MKINYKSFLLSVLIFNFFCYLSFSQVVADTVPEREISLGEILVTTARTPVSAQKTARIVTVKEKGEIVLSQVNSIADILRGIAGTDIRQRGPFGVQSDISIRGGTFEQTLVLLNGINLSDPQTGHHTMNIPVDIDDIERIEILKGPAAKSFGPNAFNGVVNIIAGTQDKNKISAKTEFGTNGYLKTGFSVSGALEKITSHLSYNRQSSEGYIRNTDFNSDNIYLNTSIKGNLVNTGIQAGILRKDFGANSFYSSRYPDQYESTLTSFASAGIESTGTLKLAATGFLRTNRDRFELIRNNNSVPFNHHRTLTAGMNLSGSHITKFGTSSIGIDIRYESILSNNLGEPLYKPVKVKGYENIFYTKDYSRINYTLFMEQYFSAGRLNVNGGIMLHAPGELSDAGIYPGLDIGYRITGSLKLFGSINKTLRVPTFTEMFYKSPVQQGFRGLMPEKAITAEGGLKLVREHLSAELSLFKRSGKELIDWVKSPSSDSLVWRSANHKTVGTGGGEMSVTLVHPRFTESIHRRSITLSIATLNSETQPDSLLSRYVFDYLELQGIVSFEYWITGNLSLSGRVTYSDRNGKYQEPSGNLSVYPPFLLTVLKISVTGKNSIWHVGASNIFNTEWYDFGGLVQPGLWINAGVKISLTK